MSIKKHRKYVLAAFLILLVIVASISLSITAKAYEYVDPDTGNTCLIMDDADILTSSEEQQLAEDMKPALQYGNIVFVSTEVAHTGSTLFYAGDIYYELFGNNSGTLVIIDFYTREFYIASDGKNYDVITEAKANVITDNNYRYLSKGEYYEGISRTFRQIITVLGGDRISEPMKHICNAILSILAGMLICAIIVGATMGVKKTAQTDVVRMAMAHLNLTGLSTRKTNTTKHQVSSGGGGFFIGGGGGGGHSSGGFGGGGGGFGGGGGGFSGGGGGHKF
ncbi:MAG: TPM domain-containing protein [Lachnospiraceae bacterium]|nr:TPM domain-containing protein [Lachnospiraceae bacterium]